MGRLRSGLVGLLLGISSAYGWSVDLQAPATPVYISDLGHSWYASEEILFAVDSEGSILHEENVGESEIPSTEYWKNYTTRSIQHVNLDEDPEEETVVALDDRVEVYDWDGREFDKTTYPMEDLVMGACANKDWLIVAGYNGQVFGIDLDGKEDKSWKLELKMDEQVDKIYGIPRIVKDKVVFATDHALYCVEIATGKTIWGPAPYSAKTMSHYAEYNTSPMIEDGSIKIIGWDFIERCFDLETGKLEGGEEKRMTFRDFFQYRWPEHVELAMDNIEELNKVGPIAVMGKRNGQTVYVTPIGKMFNSKE